MRSLFPLGLVFALTACAAAPAVNGSPDAHATVDAAAGDSAFASGGDMAQLTCAPPGAGSCIAVYNCYFDMQCQDDACLHTCEQMASQATYGSDANAYFMCVYNASSNSTAPCWSACNDPSDAGMDMCRHCLRGDCMYDQTCSVSCSGGQCSSLAAQCFNDL